MSPYTILGLPEDAPEKDVKAAYKKLAMELHPDRNKGDKEKEERFKKVSTAYQSIISGDYLREREQQKFRAQNFHFNVDADIFDILHRQMHRNNNKNQDIMVECWLSLEEAFVGKEITLKIENDGKELKVKIPAGIYDGHRLRVPQAGDKSKPGIAPGDLYIIIRIQQHPRFHMVNNHLVTEIPISLFDALLGTNISITGIDGKVLNVVIPELTKPGNKIRVAGHGMTTMGQNIRGDMYIIPAIMYPDKLSEHQKELLRKMSLPETESSIP